MPIRSEILERLKTNDPTLTGLDLSYLNLNKEDMQILFEALTNNTILTWLDISCNRIGNEGAKIIAQNTTLLSLDVSLNQIGDEGAKAFADNKVLTTLIINQNEIGDKGATDLALNTKITNLRIGSNKIGDEGAKALAKNSTIGELFLTNNQIGDEGAEAFGGNTILTWLSLSDNPIGTKGLKALAKNTTLTSLTLYGNDITDEGAEALLQNVSLIKLEWASSKNEIWKKWEFPRTQALERNKELIVKRRNQFLQVMVILARDRANLNSVSLFAKFPNEIFLRVLSFMDYRSTQSIGKTAYQVYECAKFIVENIAIVNQLLGKRQHLKILEKSVDGKSRFRFFQSDSLPSSQTSTISDEQQVDDQSQKRHKKNLLAL